MPYEERLDAVNYYSEYLAEAGPEREREVIERLGPPQRVAAEIRADAALRELNSKAWLAEQAKAARKARKERRRAEAGGAYGYGGAGGDGAGGTQGLSPCPGDGVDGDGAGGGGTQGLPPCPGGAAEEGTHRGPNMSESFSAAGLGAMSMLSMPVARPLAVLACVLGIIGLVLGVIVVVALYVSAGAIAVCGAAFFVTSFMLLLQDPTVTLFLAGAGVALIGTGLVIGALNYLLGRAIFKGIANLSGRIRHRRVKVRKEIFNYNYAYTGGNPYVADAQDSGAYAADLNATGPYAEDSQSPAVDIDDQNDDAPPEQQADTRTVDRPNP
jgi:uncharacterized membrane protein